MGVSYSFLTNYSERGKKRSLEDEEDEETEEDHNSVPQPSTSSSAPSNPASPPVKKRLKTTEYIFKRLFLSGENSDITISALGKDWKLHKIYLGQSLYFSSMFSGSWKETELRTIHLDIPDKNVTIKSLDLVFGSLYRDDISIDPGQVISLLAAASLLQLESVIVQCAEVMAENLSVRTVISYCQCSETYGLDNLQSLCLGWLEKNLLFYSGASSLLKEIWPELMERLILSPELFVLQGEMDVYILLKKWMYLRLNPRCKKSNAALKAAADDYFTPWQEGGGEGRRGWFLCGEEEEGSSFVSVMKNLRLDHMITSSKTVNSLHADNIIPHSVLGVAMANQWKKQLMLEATFDLPISESLVVTPKEFRKRAVRCGRLLTADSPYCWRWSGYNFGVDILLSYKHRMLSVKRNVSSQSCPYSVNMKPQRLIYYRLLALSFNGDRKILWSDDSGIQQIQLQLDESELIMRIPSKVEFPLTVIFYYVITPPLTEEEEGRLEAEWEKM